MASVGRIGVSMSPIAASGCLSLGSSSHEVALVARRGAEMLITSTSLVASTGGASHQWVAVLEVGGGGRNGALFPRFS